MPVPPSAEDAPLFDRLRSAAAGVEWPALPAADAALLLSLLFQFDRSQWWKPERLRAAQMRQLAALVRHAAATVPFYRARFKAAGFDAEKEWGDAEFARLPLLARRDLQSSFDALKSERVPPSSGRVVEGHTSGSAGAPVRFLWTQLTGVFWQALTLRDHVWHRRDVGAKLAAIRSKVQEGEHAGWGSAVDLVASTGNSVLFDVRNDLDLQLRWLQQQDAAYFLTFASNMRALAQRSRELGIRLPGLREVRTIAEALAPDARALCREAWGVPLVDVYSTQEVGYIALQCPQHEHYHVQSESLLVELLDDEGRACGPGETGRVVVTSLHNYAMPLVRYDVGDYAQAGSACPCGRGLPVITRIAGRVRNMLHLPDGRRHWASLVGMRPAMPVVLRQFQCVQRSLQEIVMRVVCDRPLTAGEESQVRSALQSALGHAFAVNIEYCEKLERSAGGKFEEFKSELESGN